MDNALTVSTYPNTTRYCSQCGQPLPAGARFCPGCGTQVAGIATSNRQAREIEEEPVLVIAPPRRWKPVVAIAVAGAVVLALAAFYSIRQSTPQPAAVVATTPLPAPANVLPREPKPGAVVMAPEHVASTAVPAAAAPTSPTTPATKQTAPLKPTAVATPDDPTPPARKVADSKAAPRRAPAPEKTVEKATESSEQPTAQTPAADGDWHHKLQEELTACEAGNIFKASFCKEKVRWHYCPHHWNSVPECSPPKRTGNEH